MNFAFDAEQEELRATARAFLARNSGSEQIRTAMQSDLGHDPQVWKQIASELGWAAVPIGEEHDGLGLGAVELTALFEVTGEALLCAPLFATVCLGAGSLLVTGTDEQRRTWLPRIAGGECIAALAHTGPTGGCDPEKDVDVRWRREGGGYVLDGVAGFVVDGHTADLLIVAAVESDPWGDDDPLLALFCVPAETPGVSRRVAPTLDQTRRLAVVELSGVALPASARMNEADAGDDLREILDRAAIALAAEQVGGAQRCLDLAVAYAKERVQFGRPIGSFQAIKHKCADMMIDLESARSAAYYAACVAAECPYGAVSHERVELARVASLAKAYCSDAFFRCAADCIQIHGGVGFTWEYDVHLYFKRARSSEVLLGEPAWHRERLAREIGL